MSIGEVEVVVCVVVIVALSDERADSHERHWEPDETDPLFVEEVDKEALNIEFLESSIQEMKEPLLRCI